MSNKEEKQKQPKQLIPLKDDLSFFRRTKKIETRANEVYQKVKESHKIPQHNIKKTFDGRIPYSIF